MNIDLVFMSFYSLEMIPVREIHKNDFQFYATLVSQYIFKLLESNKVHLLYICTYCTLQLYTLTSLHFRGKLVLFTPLPLSFLYMNHFYMRNMHNCAIQ